jgi:hypothetical protein
MPILELEKDTLTVDSIKNSLTTSQNCTHPAGHCFGSDGGSGIPANLKVEPGRGGEVEILKLSDDKTKILNKFIYNKCQYCGKYKYIYEEK